MPLDVARVVPEDGIEVEIVWEIPRDVGDCVLPDSWVRSVAVWIMPMDLDRVVTEEMVKIEVIWQDPREVAQIVVDGLGVARGLGEKHLRTGFLVWPVFWKSVPGAQGPATGEGITVGVLERRSLGIGLEGQLPAGDGAVGVVDDVELAVGMGEFVEQDGRRGLGADAGNPSIEGSPDRFGGTGDDVEGVDVEVATDGDERVGRICVGYWESPVGKSTKTDVAFVLAGDADGIAATMIPRGICDDGIEESVDMVDCLRVGLGSEEVVEGVVGTEGLSSVNGPAASRREDGHCHD